jgi:predicted phosphodiesterase
VSRWADERAASKARFAAWRAAGCPPDARPPARKPRPGELAARGTAPVLAPPARVEPAAVAGDLAYDPVAQRIVRTDAPVPESGTAAPRAAVARKATVVAVLSDVHLPHPHAPSFGAARAWIRANSPDWVILNGDIMDMCAAGRFERGKNDPVHLLDEIEQFVAIANEMVRETDRLTFVEGNHEKRWDRLIGGANPAALKGIVGLSLHEVCVAHGLSKRVEWYREKVGNAGLRVGSCIVRHGDKQAGRFGSINPATTRLNKSMGVSEVVGHHHVAALATRHAHGRSAFCVANPCLAEMQEYAGSDTTWAHGFTILEVDDRDITTPHLVLITDGRFARGGVVYGGAT